MTQKNGNMNQENREEAMLSFRKTELPYRVPKGYFDNFAEQVLNTIHVDAYPKKSVFSVPAGYFDNFADSVMQKIKQQEATEKIDILEELKDIAPLLTTISRENVYTVPAGYFDNFTVKKPQAKVIALDNSKELSKKNMWKGLAVAASLLIAVLTIGLVTDNKDSNNTATITPIENNARYASAGVAIDSTKPSVQNTRTYLNKPVTQNENGSVKYVEPQKLNVINVSQEINSISSKDLEDYLNSTPAIN